ncbi:3'-5' exonuclease [Tulasnella sp. JGI-2019a]|nr:3'-5' exonuclease [Tulasnella sp. JGI-2019a]
MSNTSYPKSTELELATDSRQTAHLKKMILGQLQHTKAQSSELGHLAVDCEMVGLGPGGNKDSLARVSIVNYYGVVILDTFVRQTRPVTDYRTRYSGVRPQDVEGPGAQEFDHVKNTVKSLITGRTLIGHTLYKDLEVLHLSHQPSLIHDVRESPDWKWKYPRIRTPGLKMLVQNELGMRIQDGEHDSVTDARAAMALFRLEGGPTRKQGGGLANLNVGRVARQFDRFEDDFEDDQDLDFGYDDQDLDFGYDDFGYEDMY